MKVVIAADKFKHSLSSLAVCEAIHQGLLLASPDFNVTALPLSDGGDGLADVLAHYRPFEKIKDIVCDPLYRPVEATFLYDANTKTAFVEMAQASGLHLLKPSEYNCAETTTYGTGQLIKKALECGARKIIIGIGGSATNDCGTGMAAALGYRFLDENGKEVKPVGKNLLAIDTILAPENSTWRNCAFLVACDVTNYLTGAAGATRVYGPQKGASPEMVNELESGMKRFAGILKKQQGVDVESVRGGGAAGGMGAGCVAFLGAEIVSGAQVAFSFSGAEQHIREADVVLTGEGKLDEQTANGKLVDAVARLGLKHGKPVIALCGTVALSPVQIKACGLTAAFSILNQPMPKEEAFQQAASLLSRTAFSVGRMLALSEPYKK